MTSLPDYTQWVEKVSEWRDATSMIPAVVHDEIVKSKLDPAKAKQGPRSLVFDPLSVQFAMGYKDRRYSLTYETLKRIPTQLSLIAAIIQTRCNQVASFAVPFRMTKSLGFAIKHKNPARLTTKGEREFIQSLESFIYQCGAPDPNPHSAIIRDDFETFLKKLVRDSLMFDQACFEIVPDRKGQPYEFLAIDASTIRLAANNLDMSFSTANRLNNNLYTGISPAANQASPYKTLQVRNPETQDVPSYVQIINGQIRNTYTYNELAWGVRNPRSDIYIQGYGYGELEQLVTTITAHLYAEEYNRRFFMQGSAPKGILNFKGDNLTPDQLEAFRRQWRANLEGTENSWRTPILQTEQGVDWINLHPSNQEMEYGQWMEYLLKLTCAVFLIDPAELNFDMHGGVQQTPLFESSQEWKLKASRDRGLKPMLRFIAKLINNHVVSKIDDHFMFDFMGLDELTEQEKHELRKEQVSTYMTLNEIRRAEDLPDVPDGDIILNPTYTTAQQQRKQLLMQQQQLAASSAAPAAPPPTEEEETPQAQSGNEPSPEKQQNNQGPQYADSFTKSLKVLEINLEDESESWIDIYRGSK
ncbi:MAG: phage portal protein [Bacteroidetes bacterium]|nr:phage portal protein [Bacteroidota bacterium]